MKKTVRMVALMVALLMLCASTVAFADETIKIGGIAPLTGAVSNYGLMVQAGANTYIAEVNANGGINGKQVEITWLDDTGDAIEATNAYNQLASQGIVGLVGAVTTTPTLAVGSLAAADRMPMITASATAYDVTSAGDNIFRACFLDPYQAEVMALYAFEKLEAKTAAILYDNTNDYSIGLYEAFEAKAKELGMDIVAIEAAVENDADYSPQLSKIADTEPDVTFICYYYETAALVFRQAQDVGLESFFLGFDAWTGIETELTDDYSLLENAAYCDSFTAMDENEVVKNFVASFTEKNGAAPAGFNALGYDAAKILLTAIEEAGEGADSEAIIAAMKATDMDCATGHITFDDHNDPVKPACIMGFVDGVPTLIEKILP